MKIMVIIFPLLFASLGFLPVKAGAADVVLSFTELVLINGGMFTMGSPESEAGRSPDEGPRHHVLLDSFYIGKFEVSQKEYEEVMGVNPSRVKGPDLPVDSVSWYDAVEFCNKLSEWERLVPVYSIDRTQGAPGAGNEKDAPRRIVTWNRGANGYRLPTEAEWEYACRAGSGTPFSTGKIISVFEANYDEKNPHGAPSPESFPRIKAAGSFAANPWGLHDMHGNAGEWCWDWYGPYSGAAETNPRGALQGLFRVLRGGSYRDAGESLRSARRFRAVPSARESGAGFRVVRGRERPPFSTEDNEPVTEPAYGY